MADSAILTIEPVRVGGVPQMVRAADRLLRRHGHAPTLVYSDAESVPTDGWLSLARYFARRPLPRRETRDGLEGLAIPLWPLPQWLGYYVPAVAARRVLRESKVRLLIAGSAHGGLAFALDRRPYIAWVATLYSEEIEARASVGDPWARRLLAGRRWNTMQRQEALVLERAALVLALSPHTAETMRERFPSLGPRLRTLMCPIDTEVFRPSSNSEIDRSELESPNSQFAIPNSSLLTPNSQLVTRNSPFLLLTARIRDPRKNVDMLLRAFSRIRAQRPDLRLLITGDEPLPETRALAGELGLGNSVEFLGEVSQAALIRLCQSATLFTLPSLQEGLGISALEAIACGTPVVSTRCGGPEGFVIEGETGWLAPNNDEAAFADVVLAALADPARLAAVRESSRRYAERELSREVIEAKLLAALRDVYPDQFPSSLPISSQAADVAGLEKG